MRYLKEHCLINDGESRDCRAIEATIKDLSNRKIGTLCGTIDNQCFKTLVDMYGCRRVRGWYDPLENTMCGMIHIECNEDEAESIEEIVSEVGGSLRPNSPSRWKGFYEFENE